MQSGLCKPAPQPSSTCRPASRRPVALGLAGLALAAALAGCVGDNVGAVRAMNNPPNSCGVSFSRNIEDCRGHPY